MMNGDIVYRNILENMSDGVMTIDLNGMVITFNGAAERILELKAADILNRPFAEVFLMREGNDAFNQSILDAIYESETIQRKMVDFHTHGKALALEVTTSFLRLPSEEGSKKSAIIVVFGDVTEIKKLRDAEKKLTEELRANHKELQDAYLKIEENNKNLNAALKKVQVIRIAATSFVILLFIGLGLFSWNTKASFAGRLMKKEAKTASSKGASAVETYRVVPQPLSSSISLIGELKPLKVINVVSPFGGKIRERLFQYGQEVKKGRLLIRMDTSEVEMQLRDAEVAHIKALERLRELENWKESTDVSNAKRSLSRAKLNLEAQKQNLEDAKALYEKGIVAASEHEGARQQYTNAEMDYESSVEALDATMARAGKDNLNIARLELENVKHRLDELKRQITMADVTAPVSGTIILPEAGDKKEMLKSIEKGSPISQGEILVSIGDMEGLSVKTNVDEVEVTKIKIGQKVRITGEAFPGVLLEGKAAHVSSQSVRQGFNTSPSFEVIVSVESLKPEEKGRVLLGMSAVLEFVIYENPAALLVPIRAVHDSGGGRFVTIKDKSTGKLKDVPVETGDTTLDSVEILNGLKAEDEVVI
jgi:PAS domain S-box-containing protein